MLASLKSLPIRLAMLLLVAPTTLLAQVVLPDDYLMYSALIKFKDGSSGSGFFYGTESNLFLVTAKHVLFNPDSGDLNAESAAIIYYFKHDTNAPSRGEMSVNLLGLSTNGLIRCHPSQDLAVAHIAKKILPSSVGEGKMVYNGFVDSTYPLRINIILKKYDDVQVANEVYVFGYPSSIGIRDIPGVKAPPQIDYDLPLVRKGIVAGKNPKNKTIILDSPAYFGNSGGPVFDIEHPALGVTKINIIGVVSEFIPFVERIENKTYRLGYIQFSNSGYSVVVPTDGILEVVW